MSNSSARHAAAIAPAAAAGTAPTSAPARASAASTSSIACSSAWSVSSASTGGDVKSGVSSPSDVEEYGLMLSLQMDVESQMDVELQRTILSGVRHRDQGRPQPIVIDRGEHRVGGVGGRLVGKIDAGDHPIEQAAREHRNVDVRRLNLPAGCG